MGLAAEAARFRGTRHLLGEHVALCLGRQELNYTEGEDAGRWRAWRVFRYPAILSSHSRLSRLSAHGHNPTGRGLALRNPGLGSTLRLQIVSMQPLPERSITCDPHRL